MSYKARIKFDNREWLVVDNIEYEGVKYYYIVEDISGELENLESIEEYNGNLTLEFIHQVANGNYRNVTDKVLISKLMAIVATRNLNNEN